MPAALIKRVGEVAIYDLLGSQDEARIEKMLGLYQKLFPQYQHYVPRMRRRAEFENEHRAGHVVHYWLIEVNGSAAGIRTFRYLRNRHCGLAHSLAVDPKYRKVQVGERRLAVFMIYECLAQIIRDAEARGDAPALGMVNEVEPSALMEHYIRNGLTQLPVQYVEPIFPPEAPGRSRAEELAQAHFSPMRMGFLPNPNSAVKTYSREQIASFVQAFLVDHYGLPQNHPVVLQVINSISVERGI
ncbi:MAG: hypothetical protein IT310_12960 [Anaerolineales bacterium]|nr:hypothetical protein [Anaerolineales bacterium]